jgi:hypothetical protein
MACIVHGFKQAVYHVDEDGVLDTMFVMNVTGNTSLSISQIFAGTVTAESAGTATDADFEELTPIDVRNGFAAVRLFTSNDEITLEYDDRVLLRFTRGNSVLFPAIEGLREFIRDRATVCIIDNDLLEINFVESDYAISETSSILSTPIRLLFRNNQNPFNITLCPVTINTVESQNLSIFINSEAIGEPSRAKEEDDFRIEKITVEIPAANTSGVQEYVLPPIFVNVKDDDVDEDEQSFAIVAEIGADVPNGTSCFQTQSCSLDLPSQARLLQRVKTSYLFSVSMYEDI